MKIPAGDIEDNINNVFTGRLTPGKIHALWNLFSEEYGVVPCSFLSDSLRRKINKNLNTFPPASWKNCFIMIKDSAWLHNKGWFNLSWLMKPENFVKVLDGAYCRSMKTDLPTNAIGTTNSVQKMMKDWKKKK